MGLNIGALRLKPNTPYINLAFHLGLLYWPDFSNDEFVRAIADYQQRDRRFGKI